MNLKTKFNLTLTNKQISIDYLDEATNTIVQSTVDIPISCIAPLISDIYSRESVWATNSNLTWGAFMFDCKWEQPQYRWIIHFANMVTYTSFGSTYAPTFAQVKADILTALNFEAIH